MTNDTFPATEPRMLSPASAEQVRIDAHLRSELDGFGLPTPVVAPHNAAGACHAEPCSGPAPAPAGLQTYSRNAAGVNHAEPSSGPAPVPAGPQPHWTSAYGWQQPAAPPPPPPPPAPGRHTGEWRPPAPCPPPGYTAGNGAVYRPVAAPGAPYYTHSGGVPAPMATPNYVYQAGGAAAGPLPPQGLSGPCGGGAAGQPRYTNETHQAGVQAAATLPTTARERADSVRRGRRRRRYSGDSDPPRRRRRHYTPLSSDTSGDEEEDDTTDRRRDHRTAPIISRLPAARADLRLPAVTHRAANRLKDRREYVAVADAADKAEPHPGSVVEYVGRVANILTQNHVPFPNIRPPGYQLPGLAAEPGSGPHSARGAGYRQSSPTGHVPAAKGFLYVTRPGPVPAGGAGIGPFPYRYRWQRYAALLSVPKERVHHAVPVGAGSPAVPRVRLPAAPNRAPRHGPIRRPAAAARRAVQ